MSYLQQIITTNVIYKIGKIVFVKCVYTFRNKLLHFSYLSSWLFFCPVESSSLPRTSCLPNLFLSTAVFYNGYKYAIATFLRDFYYSPQVIIRVSTLRTIFFIHSLNRPMATAPKVTFLYIWQGRRCDQVCCLWRYRVGHGPIRVSCQTSKNGMSNPRPTGRIRPAVAFIRPT